LKHVETLRRFQKLKTLPSFSSMGQPNERGWLTSNDIPDLDLSSFPTGSPNRVLLVVVDDTPRGRLVAGTLVETIEPLVGAIAATRACNLDDAISKKICLKNDGVSNSWDDDIPNISQYTIHPPLIFFLL
jgi:hypothetical protein